MAWQNSTKERESIFEKLARKLEQTGNGSGNSAPEQPKMNSLGNGSTAGQKNVAEGMALFAIVEERMKQATTIIPKVTEEPVKKAEAPEMKISDFNWNKPFNIYGRMLRKDGAGFGDENVTAHFTKLYSIQQDLEDLAAKAEEIKQVIQEGSEATIELDYVNKKISEIEKRCTLAKLSEKREAFLHYAGFCYVGLLIVGRGSSQSEKQSPEKDKEDCQSVRSAYDLLLEMARNSFIKHNRDPAKPKDKDSTKEEDIENKDAAKTEDLARMCGKAGPAYDVFQKTIVELVGLFAKQFSVMSPTSIRLYHNMLHGNNMTDLLASLGSPSLTTPLLQIEYLSKF